MANTPPQLPTVASVTELREPSLLERALLLEGPAVATLPTNPPTPEPFSLARHNAWGEGAGKGVVRGLLAGAVLGAALCYLVKKA